MEQDRRVQLIDLAIQKLIQDNRRNKGGTHHHPGDDDDAEYQLALSHLLSSASQLEAMQSDELLKQSEPSIPSELVAASAIHKVENEKVGSSGEEEDRERKGTETEEEIVKELKKVKRQNFVTHCLLSVMIVVTVAWQLSEASLIMKIKDGINNPFRSFGSMLKGIVKVPDTNNNGHEPDNNKEHPPSLNIQEMSNMAAQNLGFNNGEH